MIRSKHGLWGLLVVIASACTREAEVWTPPVDEASITVPDGTPGELVALIQKHWQSAEQAVKGGADDLVVQTHLYTGVVAADKVLEHPEADETAKKIAQRAKLFLLFLGYQEYNIPFGERLRAQVTTLLETDPRTEEAALGSAYVLEMDCLGKNLPPKKVLRDLAAYGRLYRESRFGAEKAVELLEKYGAEREAKNDAEGAKEVYRTALVLFPRHPREEAMRTKIKNLRRPSAVAGIDRAETEKIRARLGDEDDGYFVIYAEEQVNTRPGQMMYFYHYDYVVLRGLDEVVSYVTYQLPVNWIWKLARRFPDTPDGGREAYEHREELFKKKKGKG